MLEGRVGKTLGCHASSAGKESPPLLREGNQGLGRAGVSQRMLGSSSASCQTLSLRRFPCTHLQPWRLSLALSLVLNQELGQVQQVAWGHPNTWKVPSGLLVIASIKSNF